MRPFDPTHTKLIRSRLRREAGFHIQKFEQRLRLFVVEQKVLGHGRYGVVELPDSDKADRLKSFRELCNYFIHQDMESKWANKFLIEAYNSGQKAAMKLEGVDLPLSKIDPVSFLNFSHELDGITQATLQHILRAVDINLSPHKLYRNLADVVDRILVNRTNTLCNVFVVRLHNWGRLKVFRDNGVEEFGVQAELITDAKAKAKKVRLVKVVTAGDNKVCPICEDLEGQVLTYAEAMGRLPFHPNCRCAVVPFRRKKK